MISTSIRQNWATIWQSAVWLGGITFLALASPPRFLGSELPSNNTVKVTELVLAVCIGFCFFIFRSATKSKRAKYAYLSIFLLLTAIVLFFSYEYQYAAWTCTFDGRGPVTIGTTLSPTAQKFVNENPGADCEQLLKVSASKPEMIWPKNELIAHHLAMLGTFFALVLSFALAILLMSFAIGGRVNGTDKQ